MLASRAANREVCCTLGVDASVGGAGRYMGCVYLAARSMSVAPLPIPLRTQAQLHRLRLYWPEDPGIRRHPCSCVSNRGPSRISIHTQCTPPLPFLHPLFSHTPSRHELAHALCAVQWTHGVSSPHAVPMLSSPHPTRRTRNSLLWRGERYRSPPACLRYVTRYSQPLVHIRTLSHVFVLELRPVEGGERYSGGAGFRLPRGGLGFVRIARRLYIRVASRACVLPHAGRTPASRIAFGCAWGQRKPQHAAAPPGACDRGSCANTPGERLCPGRTTSGVLTPHSPCRPIYLVRSDRATCRTVQ